RVEPLVERIDRGLDLVRRRIATPLAAREHQEFARTCVIGHGGALIRERRRPYRETGRGESGCADAATRGMRRLQSGSANGALGCAPPIAARRQAVAGSPAAIPRSSARSARKPAYAASRPAAVRWRSTQAGCTVNS